MFNGFQVFLYNRALSFYIPEPIFNIAFVQIRAIGAQFYLCNFSMPAHSRIVHMFRIKVWSDQISSYSDNTEEYRLDFYVF